MVDSIGRGKRVLFVEHAASWTGPAESLSLLLPELQECGFRPSVLAVEDGVVEKRMRELGFPVWTVPAISKRYLQALVAAVGSSGADVVYSNNAGRPARLVYVAARFHRRPFVVHVRSMGWAERWSKLWYFNDADSVIAVSRAAAASVERFVRPGRLHVVHNGIPAAVPTSNEPGIGEREAGGRERGGTASMCTIAVVAHVTPRKNQLAAVDAVAALGGGPPVRLVLAGSHDRDPAYVAAVRERARTLGLERVVELPGFREDVQNVYNEADILLHTALEDPHPRVVLEGMAAGLPVVAFGVDGVAETVVHGRTGLIGAGVDGLAEALGILLRSPDLRRRMGEAGREHVNRNFSAGVTARRIAEILERL